MTRVHAVLAVIVAATAGLGASACRHAEDAAPVEPTPPPSVSQAERVIHGLGLGLFLPGDWRGRIVAAPRTAYAPLAVLHAASLPLARGDDEFGTKTSVRMAADDVRIVLFEFPAEQVGTQGFRPISLPLTVRRADVGRHRAVPADHGLARRRFAYAGRPFTLFVEFGRRDPQPGQLAVVRRMLERLSIAARPEGNEAYWRPLLRPLHLPTLTRGAKCPISAVGRAAPKAGVTLGDGPAYPVVPPNGVASLRDDLRAGGWYLHKMMWVVHRRYSGPVIVRGRQINADSQLRFDRRRLAELRLPGAPAAAGRWRYYPSYTALLGPGCFAVQIDGRGFSDIVVFAARWTSATQPNRNRVRGRRKPRAPYTEPASRAHEPCAAVGALVAERAELRLDRRRTAGRRLGSASSRSSTPFQPRGRYLRGRSRRIPRAQARAAVLYTNEFILAKLRSGRRSFASSHARAVVTCLWIPRASSSLGAIRAHHSP